MVKVALFFSLLLANLSMAHGFYVGGRIGWMVFSLIVATACAITTYNSYQDYRKEGEK